MSNFKVGDIVKTRDGREVEILKIDAPGVYPLWVGFLDGQYPYVISLTENGGSHQHNSYDLLPPKRTREVTLYVNVYPTHEMVYWTDSEALDKVLREHALAVAVPVQFTVEW